MDKEFKETIHNMKNSKISNYVIAGLDSYLIGGEGLGTVRLFENQRAQQDSISPHSHRFDFSCLVLEGSVINRIWTETNPEGGDFFETSTLRYSGEVGSHDRQREGRDYWRYDDEEYHEGDFYSMTSDQVHSIIFSRGAKVLFFEQPQKQHRSIILEPVVNGNKIPTYRKEDWMFKVG